MAETPWQYAYIETTARLDVLELALVAALQSMGDEACKRFIANFAPEHLMARERLFPLPLPELYLQKVEEHGKALIQRFLPPSS